MNERIKQLWETSDEIKVRYPEQGSPVSVSAETLEKFAELIAWECIDLSLGSSHREDDMGAIIANKIKRHFGVNSNVE